MNGERALEMHAAQTLEFHKVKENISTYTMSYLGRRQVEELEPSMDVKRIQRLLDEVTEAKAVIEHGASVPIPSLEGVERIMGLLGKGYFLDVHELSAMSQFVESTQQLKRFMLKRETIAPRVTAYAYALEPLEDLLSELFRCLRNGQVADQATRDLSRVRKEISVSEERVKKKLDSLMQKYKSVLQDAVISMRGNRYVIPVKRAYKNQVEGHVLDESASGQTVFIEPAGIASLQQELSGLRTDEELEVTRVLSYLTGLVEQEHETLQVNLETIGAYDFLFAKAKYAHETGGRSVQVSDHCELVIRGGRHPLLGKGAAPLEFSIGRGYRALLITGPNTGGKTVSLKTVGLLSMMVQAGILVPVEEGSSFPLYANVLADIGDGQSIEQSLSTFSAHIKNVIRILASAGPRTLVLLDELASGTDPGEGIGLSIAVLEELYRRGSTIVATTHFNEIKEFAARTDGFENARMEFDVETLQPLYRLRIGEAGMSYAFVIARKLGLSEPLIRRSQQIVAEQGVGGERAQKNHSESIAGNGVWARVNDGHPLANLPSSKHRESALTRHTGSRDIAYQAGDRVWIHPLKKSGIVCTQPDARGNLEIMVQKQKQSFNVKRVSPYLSKDELYPEDYDLDIVLESKEVRKKRKIMRRKHVPGMTIDHQTD